MKAVVSIATLEHARELAAMLRPEDEAECLASGYATALEALEAGVKNSDCAWAIHFGGELGVVMGVDRFDNGAAYLWCLTGTVVDRAKLSFWRISKVIIEQCRKRYGWLFACADARYARAVSWLVRLGFSVGWSTSHPSSGVEFKVMHIGGL